MVQSIVRMHVNPLIDRETLPIERCCRELIS